MATTPRRQAKAQRKEDEKTLRKGLNQIADGFDNFVNLVKAMAIVPRGHTLISKGQRYTHSDVSEIQRRLRSAMVTDIAAAVRSLRKRSSGKANPALFAGVFQPHRLEDAFLSWTQQASLGRLRAGQDGDIPLASYTGYTQRATALGLLLTNMKAAGLQDKEEGNILRADDAMRKTFGAMPAQWNYQGKGNDRVKVPNASGETTFQILSKSGEFNPDSFALSNFQKIISLNTSSRNELQALVDAPNATAEARAEAKKTLEEFEDADVKRSMVDEYQTVKTERKRLDEANKRPARPKNRKSGSGRGAKSRTGRSGASKKTTAAA